tara:strand:+ start:419 stop:1006 length:588 start_codon:yes stop_codon:yes gene_type:complete
MENRCSPAIIFIAFSLIQIIIDIFKNLYNTALIKFIVMIMFFIILNILCEQGLTILSWFIVFIPFVMMSIITSLILFVFGLSPDEEKLNYKIDSLEKKSENEDPRAMLEKSNTKKTEYSPKNVEDKDTIDIIEKKTCVITDLNNETQETDNINTAHHHHNHNHNHNSKYEEVNNNISDDINELLNNADNMINKYS